MQGVKDATNAAVPHPALYWVVYNATLHAHAICSALVDAGFARAALPFAIHAALAMEAHTALRHPRHLAWRAELTRLVCAAYLALGLDSKALAFLDHMARGVAELEKTLRFEPVPLPAALREHISAANEALAAQKLRLELRGRDEAAVTAQAAALGSGAARIAALLAAVQVPGRRLLAKAPPAGLAGALAALKAEVQKAAGALTAGIAERREAMQEAAGAEVEASEVAAAAIQEAGAHRCTCSANTCGRDNRRCCTTRTAAMSSTCWPHSLLSGAGATAEWSEGIQSAAAALPADLHLQSMCAFYTHQDDAFFQTLAELADDRCSTAGDLCAEASTTSLLAATGLLRTAHALAAAATQGLVSDAITSSATQLLNVAAQMGRVHVGTLPGACDTKEARHPAVLALLEDTALLLWRTARPLIDGVACMRDREAALVANVLAALHACFSAVDQDDALLRCDLAQLCGEKRNMIGQPRCNPTTYGARRAGCTSATSSRCCKPSRATWTRRTPCWTPRASSQTPHARATAWCAPAPSPRASATSRRRATSRTRRTRSSWQTSSKTRSCWRTCMRTRWRSAMTWGCGGACRSRRRRRSAR